MDSSAGVGRVEIFHNGSWGTVCENGWNMYTADLACREVGYLRAVRIISGTSVPPGSGNILSVTWCWIYIRDCDIYPTDQCNHSQDVGVQCSNKPGKHVYVYM